MLRGRSGLPEAQAQLLDTVTNGDLDNRVVEAAMPRCTSRTGRHRRGPTPRTPAWGQALAAAAEQVAGAAALAGAWRPAAAANAADAVGHAGSSEVGAEADDDDGDELERALGRNLDARAAEVSQPGWEEPARGRGRTL